jgi:hypothetical protein
MANADRTLHSRDYANSQQQIGSLATLITDGWFVTVVVTASRVCYGRTDYKITQPKYPGTGRWVSSSRISFDD